jgi:hypothetical protein
VSWPARHGWQLRALVSQDPPRTPLHSLVTTLYDCHGLQAPFPAIILLEHRTLRLRSHLRTYQFSSVTPETQVLRHTPGNYMHTDCYHATAISGESIEFVPCLSAHQLFTTFASILAAPVTTCCSSACPPHNCMGCKSCIHHMHILAIS